MLCIYMSRIKRVFFDFTFLLDIKNNLQKSTLDASAPNNKNENAFLLL